MTGSIRELGFEPVPFDGRGQRFRGQWGDVPIALTRQETGRIADGEYQVIQPGRVETRIDVPLVADGKQCDEELAFSWFSQSASHVRLLDERTLLEAGGPTGLDAHTRSTLANLNIEPLWEAVQESKLDGFELYRERLRMRLRRDLIVDASSDALRQRIDELVSLARRVSTHEVGKRTQTR
jgi:hypothetical protein